MSVKVGEKAPSFTLRNTIKEEVSLSDYKNKNLVVLFFPLAFTGVCTAELCEMRDSIADYNNLDAEVVAISVDSLFVLAKYKEDQRFNFPLLSDYNKEVSRAYGSLYEEFVFGMKGVSKRSAFVIDKEGTIKYAEILENASDIPNFGAVKDALANC